MCRTLTFSNIPSFPHETAFYIASPSTFLDRFKAFQLQTVQLIQDTYGTIHYVPQRSHIFTVKLPNEEKYYIHGLFPFTFLEPIQIIPTIKCSSFLGGISNIFPKLHIIQAIINRLFSFFFFILYHWSTPLKKQQKPWIDDVTRTIKKQKTWVIVM